ncbi:hypothetical protein SLEP1_g26276 [Rubroshorea leprosula]|uniref:Uncharacterized protein n=1 Tax=Rubroshorea leprosula TaxID=152421 RepID=A0AAV5JL63_9ROSI|nr:hypothetical protein SLEP1_g26276 [Rubroshorea leprosula]
MVLPISGSCSYCSLRNYRSRILFMGTVHALMASNKRV